MDQSPQKGSIQLTSSPSGSEIYLDSQFQGSTPSTIAGIEPGNHTLEFRYPGYQSWSTTISVPAGTSSFFAALVPLPATEVQQTTVPETTGTPVVTIGVDHNPMVIGNSMVFSGTCTMSSTVLLTLYGPGYYMNGVQLGSAKTNALDAWSYTWNPGTSIQSGTYTMVVNDAQKTTSDRVIFTVIGGGIVSISLNSYSAARGDTLRISGQCTSGAPNVDLVLSGPGRFAGGVEIGTISVGADDTWSFRYTIDSSMPTGIYTVYVYDVPKTASSTTQFTVGYRS